MLKLDAVSVSAPGGVCTVDPQGVIACTHRIGHDFTFRIHWSAATAAMTSNPTDSTW